MRIINLTTFEAIYAPTEAMAIAHVNVQSNPSNFLIDAWPLINNDSKER